MLRKGIFYFMILLMSSCIAQDDISIAIKNNSNKHIDSIHFIDIKGTVHKVYNIKPKLEFKKTIDLKGYKNTGDDKLVFSVYVFSNDKVCTWSDGLVDYPYLSLKNSYFFYLFETGLNNKSIPPNTEFEYWHTINKENLKKLRYYEYTRNRFPSTIIFSGNKIDVPEGFKSLSLTELSKGDNYVAWNYASDEEEMERNYLWGIKLINGVAIIHEESPVQFKSFNNEIEGVELKLTIGKHTRYNYYLKGKINNHFVTLKIGTKEKINNNKSIPLISSFVKERKLAN